MIVVLLVGLTAAQTPGPPPPVVEAPTSTWSVSTEYVVWWLRRGYLPRVLTTSSVNEPGRFSRPDPLVVYGDERLETRHDDRFIGTRFAVEWRHPSGVIGAEGRAFFLERDSTYFTLKHRSSPQLALSYIDANTLSEKREVIAGIDPDRGPLLGGFVGYSRIELFGQEANAVVPMWDGPNWEVDLLAGVRFLQMRDRYHHTATSFVLPEKATLYGVVDNIRVHNAFYGGQVGLRGEYRFDRWYVQVRGSMAIGADDQLVRTWGQRIVHTPEARVQTERGLFVQPSNTGRFSRCHFDGVGEVAINAGYQITPWLRGFMGYTFLGWADPLRAATQVDRVVNVQQPGEPERPTIPFKGDGFWAQGINFGLEARW
jgi:hypothetical protein